MFGMVLAIGLLVDDAIVVVKNVERVMEQEDVSPLEATRRSMEQISGALVGIAVVLSAVFLPMFFFPGSSGVVYRQFSLTIVSSMTLSVLMALSFTPALCATILKRPKHGERRGFFGWFNRSFDRTGNRYAKGAGYMASRAWRSMLVYAAIAGAMGILYLRLPSSFMPMEDQGIMYVQVTAPPGATAGRTQQALMAVSDYLLKDEASRVQGVLTISGFNFGGRSQAVEH